MANELRYHGDWSDTGLTIIARVYTTAGVQVGADAAMTEVGGDGRYYGDAVGLTSGDIYDVRYLELVSTGPDVYTQLDATSGKWNGVEFETPSDALSAGQIRTIVQEESGPYIG